MPNTQHTQNNNTDYDPHNFAHRRHVGPTPYEIAQMLDYLGVDDLDSLIDETIPRSIQQQQKLDWPALTEPELLAYMRALAQKNRPLPCVIGQGYYGTHMPAVIQNTILENPAWYTAYTPYQPEISQGRLEALLNFQTMVSDLTGLPIANASLLDEATACAEAVVMAAKTTPCEQHLVFVADDCHPQNISVLQTRAEPLGIKIITGQPEQCLEQSTFAVVLQYPGTYGKVRDYSALIERAKEKQTIVIMVCDLLALTLLREPGSMGADIAVGSAQRFGLPMGNGGPHAAFIAAQDQFKRVMPGRIVGVSRDHSGKPCYRLSLQTREQHIRREKATSNICTAQALPAILASFYAVFHGAIGLRAIADTIHTRTRALAVSLSALGWHVPPSPLFDTITIDIETRDVFAAVLDYAAMRDINVRAIQKGETYAIGLSLDETTTNASITKIIDLFASIPSTPKTKSPVKTTEQDYSVPESMQRQSPYLTHPIFCLNRAETEITRYIKRLADRDLALDRAMIPLGSCTMKLNARCEMMPITWDGFAMIHPFAPIAQKQGYHDLFQDLSEKLCAITGFDAVSLQPNSGAQGEYAGLLTIRAYHHSKGDTERTVCLIPTSAHGTNPASARMAGMDVIAVKVKSNGDIDIEDLEQKAAKAGTKLAACMVTYPSTHGVFESTIQDMCTIVHRYGGQVYLDGANMNAMVGLSRPADIGADVCHLNLHKTFCIPHGGGGPGMGPIGVKAHLVPYLPENLSTAKGGVGSVSGTVFGSASILAISYAYCLLMGGEGLTYATQIAILNANYLAARLARGTGTGNNSNVGYSVLYSNANGRVAHECIIDTRPFQSYGITVDDIAKRLIDCGFHAPTMSWPVLGTLMIEPTESETKSEIDRFCDAMLAIRAEIEDIAMGKIAVDDSALKRAPHCFDDFLEEVWGRAYSRLQAAQPVEWAHREGRLAVIERGTGGGKVDKFWPPVGRVDNAYGDRNLVCTCPPVDES